MTLSGIGPLLDEGRERFSDLQSPEHRTILEAVNNGGMGNFSLEECGDIANYLSRAVEADAFAKEGFISSSGEDIAAVDESRYPEEIRLLHKLSQRFQYSSAIEHWLMRKRHAFVDEAFKGDSELMKAKKCWATMTIGERKNFLTAVMRSRIESASDRDFSFVMPNVEIAAIQNLGRADRTLNQIDLNKDLLHEKDPSAALETLYHEGTHNLLTQLAYMTRREGQISPFHSLYEDMQKAMVKKLWRWESPLIPSLYKVDTEEVIADREGKYFLANIALGHGLRSKFNIVCSAIVEILDGEPPIHGVRSLLHNLRLN